MVAAISVIGTLLTLLVIAAWAGLHAAGLAPYPPF
jgi:hypothetical protein